LTTTQRMKEFRTAHSESVVKEREHEPSRSIYQNCYKPNSITGVPSVARTTALLRSFGATQGTLRSKTEGWFAIRSSKILFILHSSSEGWWR